MLADAINNANTPLRATTIPTTQQNMNNPDRQGLPGIPEEDPASPTERPAGPEQPAIEPLPEEAPPTREEPEAEPEEEPYDPQHPDDPADHWMGIVTFVS